MMKKILIICCVIISIRCNSQDKTIEFEKFVSGFIVCSFPINTSNYFKELKIHANDPCNIEEKDFNTFLNWPKDSFWKYKMYSENNNTFFDYVKGCRFEVNENLVSILYFRDYFCEDISQERSELILSVFNKSGKLISNIPISGGNNDSLTFTSIINSSKDIEVNYTKYDNESKKEYTKHFEIRETGQIIEKK